MTTTPAPIKLPAGHARDWLGRCEAADEATVVASTDRTVTLDLTDAALADLIADAIYYAEEMHPGNTGDVDYRPKARTLLRAIDRVGVSYTRRPGTYTITITGRRQLAPARPGRPTEHADPDSLGGRYVAAHGIAKYRTEYERGWRAGLSGTENGPFQTGGASDAYEDGYYDAGTGRAKWHRTRCAAHHNAEGGCGEA